jgi:hypothetical protein
MDQKENKKVLTKENRVSTHRGLCRGKEENLLRGEVKVIGRWEKYFEKLQNMKGTGSKGEKEEPERYANVEKETETPYTGGKRCNKYPKNNEARGKDAIIAEMIKYGNEKSHLILYQPILDIWEKEELPEDF